jgi:hypothetical protein
MLDIWKGKIIFAKIEKDAAIALYIIMGNMNAMFKNAATVVKVINFSIIIVLSKV